MIVETFFKTHGLIGSICLILRFVSTIGLISIAAERPRSEKSV